MRAHRLGQLLVVALGLAGCKAADSLIVVTVDAAPSLTGVAYLHTVASAGTRTMEYDVGKGGAPFDLPPTKTFAFDVSTLSSGSFSVTVEARDSSDNALASGGGSVNLAAGERRDIAITLGGIGDGGTPDFAGCIVTVSCQSLNLVCGTPSDGCGGTLDCGPCQLNAIYQPLGISGSNITVEGKFNSDALVHFPGGLSAAATLLGANRATVTVPVQATSGSLTITSGGMTTAPLPFRRPSFPLGLPVSFSPEFEQASYARQTPSLATARGGHSAVAVGNWLFVLGGFNSGALDTVERAMINADGTLGAFKPGGTLHTASNAHASVVLGNWVYVIGGSNGSALSRVERAPILATGLLGSFADAGVALTVPRSGATATIVGDQLYVIGGSNGSGALPTVERSQIAGDGTLGAFTDTGVTLRTARSLHTATVSGNSLYVVGGSAAAGSYLDRIERATIHGDGTIDAFVDAGIHLVTARASQQMQVLGDHVFVFGGGNGSPLATIETAAIASDGTFGAVTTLAGISSIARADFASVIIGNFVYEIGGGAPSSSIDRATINSSGSLSTFAVAPVALPAPTELSGAAVVVGNTLYAIAGNNSAHAPIKDDGTLGPFVADSALTATGNIAVVGNAVYAINQTQSQRAPINGDGTIGPWANVTISGKSASAYYSLCVSGATLYSIDGATTGATSTTVVEGAPIANDTLGTFTTSGVPQTASRRIRGASVLLGTNVFAYAGFDSVQAGITPGAEHSPLDGTLSLGAWSGTGVASLQNFFDPAAAVAGPKFYVLAHASSGTAVYACGVTDTTLALAAVPGVTTKATSRQFAATLVTSSNVYVIGGFSAPNTLGSIEQASLQ